MINITKFFIALFLAVFLSACATSETRSTCRGSNEINILKLGGKSDDDFYPKCSEGTTLCDKSIKKKEDRTCHVVKCKTSC